jgi:hypothetical protein
MKFRLYHLAVTFAADRPHRHQRREVELGTMRSGIGRRPAGGVRAARKWG